MADSIHSLIRTSPATDDASAAIVDQMRDDGLLALSSRGIAIREKLGAIHYVIEQLEIIGTGEVARYARELRREFSVLRRLVVKE